MKIILVGKTAKSHAKSVVMSITAMAALIVRRTVVVLVFAFLSKKIGAARMVADQQDLKSMVPVKNMMMAKEEIGIMRIEMEEIGKNLERIDIGILSLAKT
jgi:hypothetical protein